MIKTINNEYYVNLKQLLFKQKTQKFTDPLSHMPKFELLDYIPYSLN